MPLTPTHRRVLALLRAHRTERSWIAGSAVLHRILTREIGDIDIHHASADDMHRAFTHDTAVLRREGFSGADIAQSEHEIECVLRAPSIEIGMNWVHSTDERFFPLEQDVELGWRISVADAVFQKLLMVFDGDEDKHFGDLADCANARLLSEALVHAAARQRSPDDPPNYVTRIENGIRSATGTIDGASYRTMPASPSAIGGEPW